MCGSFKFAYFKISVVKMVLKLYYDDESAPCRAVLLTIKALDLNVDLQEINLLYKEQLTPGFVKINPQHTVPTLVDEDLILCDSHAISGYLVAKFGNNSTLYPCDPRGRALVDQKLHFDSNIFLPRLFNLFHPILKLGEKEIAKEKLNALKEGYEFLDKFLEGNVFLAGENLTIADFSCVASISTSSIILPVSAQLYPRLFKWYQQCKALPYYEEGNGVGLNKVDALIQSRLGCAYTKTIK